MYWKELFKDKKMEIVDSFTGEVDCDYYNNSDDMISFDVYSDELEQYGYFQGQAIFEEITTKRILDMNLKTGDRVNLDIYKASPEDYAEVMSIPLDKVNKYELYFVDIVDKY